MDHGCDCQCGRAEDRGSSRLLTRRGVLAGTAAVTATLALGACADSDDAAASDGSASSAPAATDQPTDQASASAEPLATTDEFPVGGGKVVGTSNGPVVLTHPTDEDFLAFSGTCTHQGCTVAEVTENTILCTCHGSTFDGSTGDRLEGPAPTGLDPVAIRVDGGSIFLA